MRNIACNRRDYRIFVDGGEIVNVTGIICFTCAKRRVKRLTCEMRIEQVRQLRCKYYAGEEVK